MVANNEWYDSKCYQGYHLIITGFSLGAFRVFRPVSVQRWKEILWIMRGERPPAEIALTPEKEEEYLEKVRAYRSREKKLADNRLRVERWRQNKKCNIFKS